MGDEMDNLTAYRAIKAHFEQPDARLSKSPDGDCYYRCPCDFSENDTYPELPRRDEKCSVGVIIPDDVYEHLMDTQGAVEGTSASDVLKSAAGLVMVGNLFDELDGNFLDDVQNAHDGSNRVSEFLVLLDQVAAKHGVI